MTDNNRNAPDKSVQYRTPQVEVIEVKAQGLLCLSNEPMGENDISDAFHQD